MVVHVGVPMFYDILRLYLIYIIAIVPFHQPAAWLWHGAIFLLPTPAVYGPGLPFIYAARILAVAVVYVPCGWLMQFKRQYRDGA